MEDFLIWILSMPRVFGDGDFGEIGTEFILLPGTTRESLPSSKVVESDRELLSEGMMSSGKVRVDLGAGFFPHLILYSLTEFSISCSFFSASVYSCFLFLFTFLHRSGSPASFLTASTSFCWMKKLLSSSCRAGSSSLGSRLPSNLNAVPTRLLTWGGFSPVFRGYSFGTFPVISASRRQIFFRRDSNSRPNEELICFLHVYLRLRLSGSSKTEATHLILIL